MVAKALVLQSGTFRLLDSMIPRFVYAPHYGMFPYARIYTKKHLMPGFVPKMGILHMTYKRYCYVDMMPRGLITISWRRSSRPHKGQLWPRTR